jgi:c-di-AMP phosphodiesterase-like protein
MIPSYTLVDNPFFLCREGVLVIKYQKQSYRFSIDSITRIFLSKDKRKYLRFLPDFSFERTFVLHVYVNNQKELSLGIKTREKRQFIELIAFARKQISLQNYLAA